MRATSSLTVRLAVTLMALALMLGLKWIPLPEVSQEAVALYAGPPFADGSRFSLSPSVMGLRPFLIGFLVVELLSLVLPPGPRLRRDGVRGRARLTQISLALGTTLAFVQAYRWVEYLASLGSPFEPAVPDGRGVKVLLVLTLVAASAALLGFAAWITSRGFGHGVALYLCVDLALSLAPHLSDALSSREEAINAAISLTIVGVVAALLVRFCRRSVTFVAFDRRDGSRLDLDMPSFPQGLVPLDAAVAAVGLPTALGILQIGWQPFSIDSFWVLLAVVIVLLPPASWLTGKLFSSRSRVESDLRALVCVDESYEERLTRQWRRALAVLLMTTSGILLASYLFEEAVLLAALNGTELIALVAFGIDIADEWRFRRTTRSAEIVVELDNPHLAVYLVELLKARGVAAFARGLSFRSLFFFFAPLVKIQLIVDSEKAEEASNHIRQRQPEVL